MVCLASQSRGSPLFIVFEEVPLSSSRDALIKQLMASETWSSITHPCGTPIGVHDSIYYSRVVSETWTYITHPCGAPIGVHDSIYYSRVIHVLFD